MPQPEDKDWLNECSFLKIWLFVFLLLNCIRSFYMLDINCLSDMYDLQIFSSNLWIAFHFVDYFLCHSESFNLMYSHLFILLLPEFLVLYKKKMNCQLCCQCSVFSRRFIVSDLTFIGYCQKNKKCG